MYVIIASLLLFIGNIKIRSRFHQYKQHKDILKMDNNPIYPSPYYPLKNLFLKLLVFLNPNLRISLSCTPWSCVSIYLGAST